MERESALMKTGIQPLAFLILLLALSSSSFSQQKNKSIVCKNEAFAALKPLPELTYQCPDDVNGESDDRILQSPERKQAAEEVVRKLSSFTSPAWWRTAVGDLNACALHRGPGELTSEEREQYTGPEYQPRVMGDGRIRLVLIPDPCYQTYYNGLNGYLLYRAGPQVYVTELLNGYYSRLGKSIFLKLHRMGRERVIEVETVNLIGMRPKSSRKYYVINRATNEAVPKKRSRAGKRRGGIV